MSKPMLQHLALLFVMVCVPTLRAEHRAAPCADCLDCRTCEVCYPTIEKVTEEEKEWKVDCEKKCIPAIRFPWEPHGSKLTLFSWWRPDGAECRCACTSTTSATGAVCRPCGKCPPIKCGAVRSVSVLGEESREVTVCKCKWEIRPLAPSCVPHACSSGCDCGAPTWPREKETTGALPLPAD